MRNFLKNGYMLGIKHFFLVMIFSFFAAIVLSTILLPFIIGLFFAPTWIISMVILIFLVLGIYIVTYFLIPITDSSDEDIKKVVTISTSLFLLSCIMIVVAIYFGDQTPRYGVTPREELTSLIPFLGFFVIVYKITVSWIIKLKRKKLAL